MASTAKNSPNHVFLEQVTSCIQEDGDGDVSDDNNNDDDAEHGRDEPANAASATEQSTDEPSNLQKKSKT